MRTMDQVEGLSFLKNGCILLESRRRAGRLDRLIVLAYRPDHLYQPFATWEMDPTNGETYNGDYFSHIDDAASNFALRASH